jgi:hypothetical protein
MPPCRSAMVLYVAVALKQPRAELADVTEKTRCGFFETELPGC